MNTNTKGSYSSFDQATEFRPQKDMHQSNPFFGYVRINSKNDPWHSQIKERLNELCKLAKNWDGYNSVPTTFDVAHFSYSLLEQLYREDTPLPSIVPLANGGLQIEWHKNNLDIEIVVHEPNLTSVWVDDITTEEDGVETEMTTDFSNLIPWIERLG